MHLDQQGKLYYMEIAELTANRSTCSRLSVGCVLTTPKGYILSTGYNGVPPDYLHCNISNPKKVSPCPCIHAEQNAIIQCEKSKDFSKWAFVTTFPCYYCTKLLIAFSITKIFFRKDYRNMIHRDQYKGIIFEKIL